MSLCRCRMQLVGMELTSDCGAHQGLGRRRRLRPGRRVRGIGQYWLSPWAMPVPATVRYPASVLRVAAEASARAVHL